MANKKQPKLRYINGQYGNNWKRIREQHNMTVREFSQVVNMSYSSISKIENEDVEPTMEQLYLYIDKFNASLDYLTGRTTVYNSDLRYICEYTGLSEEVISTIVTLKQPHIAWVETLNALLENEKFISLIYIISDKLNIQEEQFERAGMHSFLSNIDMIDYKISTEIKAATDEIRATIPREKTQAGKLRSWWERAMKPRNNK